MFSNRIKRFIEQGQAFHRTGCPFEKDNCHGKIKKLFDMFVCEKCHLTVDDENHILVTVPYLSMPL